MNGLIHSSLNIYSNSENYIIFNSWMYNGTHTHYFVQKFKFSSTSADVIHSENQFFFNLSNTNTVSSKSTSCSLDDSERIWCLGLIWELLSINEYHLENNTGSYFIEVFNYDLKQLFSHKFFFSPFDPDSFYKIVFLRDQICLMLIYNYNSLNIQIPSFLTIYITSDNKIMNYTNPGKIDIDYSPSIKFNSNCLLNDLIKISKYKASFTSVNTEKEKLYISIIEVYEIEKLIYKLYEIELYNLYHYKFLFDMRQ